MSTPTWSQLGKTKHRASKVQGHLKGVDKEVGLQLIYETGQRPENQIANFGLVPRQKVESGEQVTEYFNISEGFFTCMVSDSQSTKSVHRRVRLAIERNVDEICSNQNPKSRVQHMRGSFVGVDANIWFPLGRTRLRASERARTAETRGPEGLRPDDL